MRQSFAGVWNTNIHCCVGVCSCSYSYSHLRQSIFLLLFIPSLMLLKRTFVYKRLPMCNVFVCLFHRILNFFPFTQININRSIKNKCATFLSSLSHSQFDRPQLSTPFSISILLDSLVSGAFIRKIGPYSTSCAPFCVFLFFFFLNACEPSHQSHSVK